MSTSRKRWYLAIDNGLDGGICLMDTEEGKLDFLPIPKFKTQLDNMNTIRIRELHESLAALLTSRGVWQGTKGKTRNKISAILEPPIFNVMGRTSKKSVASTVASFMIHSNIMQDFADGWGIPIFTISAKTWQEEFWKPKPKLDKKQMGVVTATKLFPDVDFRKTPRSTLPHDGFTDAALMAEFARRRNM